MRKLVFYFLSLVLFVFLVHSCKKEYSEYIPEDKKPALQLSLGDDTADGSPLQEYTVSENTSSTYFFGGYAGNYFGVRSYFKMNRNAELEISFGTTLTQNPALTEAEFLDLVAPGAKEFGSLGAFHSYPQMKPGKAEIAFTDKNSVRWCSSTIEDKPTRHGVETVVKIRQPNGSIRVEEIQKLDIGPDAGKFLVKGTFDCLMYEVGGRGKKNMKGQFAGVYSPGE